VSGPARYRGSVSSQRVLGGVVHKLPADLRKALMANTTGLDAWTDMTPLARNEFICWVEDAKQKMTRERRIRRTQEELEEGQRRPCCWPGCRHRERTGRYLPAQERPSSVLHADPPCGTGSSSSDESGCQLDGWQVRVVGVDS